MELRDSVNLGTTGEDSNWIFKPDGDAIDLNGKFKNVL